MTNEIRAHLRAAESELEHAMDALIDEANTARRINEWSADLETEHQKALETMRTAWSAVFEAYRTLTVGVARLQGDQKGIGQYRRQRMQRATRRRLAGGWLTKQSND